MPSKIQSKSLFPDDDMPVRAPRTAKRAKGRSQYRRRAWEDHVRPQVFATDLVEPPTPIPTMAATVELPVGTVLADLTDDELAALVASYRSTRADVYATRYGSLLPLYCAGDPTPVPDYPDSITRIARTYREEMLATDACRAAAHGVYPVNKDKPGGRWRAQIWIPAQRASPGCPAKPGYHKNLRLNGSTHLMSESEAWLAVAKYYEEEEGIDVSVTPPVGSCMAELLGLLREAIYAAGDANQQACDERDREADCAELGD